MRTSDDMPALDVRRLRAGLIGDFIRVARQLMVARPELRSLQLGCAQFYADEARDAVHRRVIASPQLLPTRASSESIGWRVFQWDDNGDAVYAFAPHCTEESWVEEEVGEEDEEHIVSPLVIVQRVEDGSLRTSWLGGLHRAWLDFPQGFERDWESGPIAFAADPSAEPLVGEEHALFAQAHADPGAREVLRDLWIERGDVRGEMTALSIATERTAAMSERLAELVLEHGRGWLGPLAAIVPLSGALFGPGPFARKVVVYAADDEAFDAVADAAEWASVEELVFANQSYRAVTPAMTQLRSVGPLAAAQLAAFHTGAWRVEELDFDSEDGSLDALAQLALPLTRLAIRAPHAVSLAGLQHAPWWSALERLEVWLPSATSPAAVKGALEQMSASVPCAFAIGVLAGGQRSGLMAVARGGTRVLEMRQPDARLAHGPAWAAAFDLALPTTWEPPADDWCTLGLGVSITTRSKTSDATFNLPAST